MLLRKIFKVADTEENQKKVTILAGKGVDMKKANMLLLLILTGLGINFAFCDRVFAQSGDPISPAIRSAAKAQARKAAANGGEVCLSSLINRDLKPFPTFNSKSTSIQGIYADIRPLVGGRNFTAADIDSAQVPFYTLNGVGLTTLLHDGGEWPGTGGNTDQDDGVPSFSVDWAGEIYDFDMNGHYPKAVLRYIGSHCYIFVPVMYFPTLPRGISSTEEETPAAKPEWGMFWPDSGSWDNGPYYYAVATGVKTLEPRYILGADKNLARLKLKELADEFDGVIYPKMREYFGSEPDIDGDAKVFILLDDIRDGSGSFRGYFWAANQYPITSYPQSNEKELIYLDLMPTFSMSPKQGYGTIAHEFVHMIHFNEGTEVVDGVLKEEERWLEEGFTQYGQYIYDGKHTSNTDSFISAPDTILVEPRLSIWLGNSPFANYGASYLFVFYMMEKYGKANGANFMRSWFRDKATGVKSVNNILQGFDTTMEDVFGDWTIANYLDLTRKLDMSSLNDGKWGYDIDNDFDTSNDIGVNKKLPVQLSERMILGPQGAARSATVNSWAADYIQIMGNSGNINIGFDGDDRTQFKAAIIKRGPSVDPSVEFMYLNEKQSGNLIIQNYGTGNTYENLLLIPMITASGNYEKMNYIFSATFSDLKVGVFPNPVFENNLHIVLRIAGNFAATPKLQMTYNGEQGYLVMTPVNQSIYITTYPLSSSGEGMIEAYGTTAEGVILSNKLQFTAVYYPPRSEGLLKGSFASVDVPKGALKNGGVVVLAESDSQPSVAGLEKITRVIDVALPVETTEVPVRVSIPIDKSLRNKPGKVGLFKTSSSGAEFIGIPQLLNDAVVGEVSSSGGLFAAVDITPPQIGESVVKVKDGRIAIDVKDLGSGIDKNSISVRYLSEKFQAVYDKASERILINTSVLLDGSYGLTVEVADNLGNKTSANVNAQVAADEFSLSHVAVFPSPARNFANIRTSLIGPGANSVNVEASIKDSNGDEVYWTILQPRGGGIYETKWNLRNGAGRTAANGAYFVEVKAYYQSREITKKTKMAVIR